MNPKRWMRSWLRRRGLVVARTTNRGARYLEHPPTTAFESTLLRIFPEPRGLHFLQVGANDGKRADPVHPFVAAWQWRGVLVEPLPANFRQLARTYAGNSRLQLLNVALDARAGTRPIYFLRADCREPVPDWAWGLASFDRRRVETAIAELHLPPDALAEETITTMTWTEVWQLMPGAHCDLLVLDTEGYDLALLRGANLAARRPRMIHFEHACVPREDQFAFYHELADLGYEIATDQQDTTAWLRS